MIRIALAGEYNPPKLAEECVAKFPSVPVSFGDGELYVFDVEDTPENLAILATVIAAHDPAAKTEAQLEEAAAAAAAVAQDEMLARFLTGQVAMWAGLTEFERARYLAYQEAGLAIDLLAVALWEKVVEGKTDAEAGVADLQARREAVKALYPKEA